MGKDGLGDFADVLEDDVLVVSPKHAATVANLIVLVDCQGTFAFFFIEEPAATAPDIGFLHLVDKACEFEAFAYRSEWFIGHASSLLFHHPIHLLLSHLYDDLDASGLLLYFELCFERHDSHHFAQPLNNLFSFSSVAIVFFLSIFMFYR